jgi:hypothetical protein
VNEPRIRQSSSLDVVARHEAAALAALEAAAGGAPLCRIDGTRQSVKASEGAVVALSDVRRTLSRDHDRVADDSAERAHSVIDDVRLEWASISGPLAARPGSEEYIAGGLEALSSLEDALRRGGSDVPAPDPTPPDVAALTAPPVLGPLDSSTSSATVRWPRRRRVAAAVIMVGLVVLIGATAGWTLTEAPLWTVLAAGTVVLSSLALALFVPHPGEGWRPDFGCAPCAVAGLALAVAGPWLAIETAHEGGRAGFALVLAGAALARRLTEPPVCGTPGSRP